MRFHDLNLIEPLMRALSDEGFERPTPVQTMAIPHVLEGRDLVGCAQTGTGKTAAFALPILQRLAHPPFAPTHSSVRPDPLAGSGEGERRRHPAERAHAGPRNGARPIRALVLSPTRELASQIAESFSAFGRHLRIRCDVIFGGVSQKPQTAALERGTDILVATPGRLLDLMEQGHIRFDRLEVFVLDEADRMLDMGFVRDVRKVIQALPRRRQTLLFSATLPDAIRTLARDILKDPARVDVSPEATTPEKIGQSVFYVEKRSKGLLLIDVLRDPAITRALVFTRTKHGANRVVRQLEKARIPALAIHGNKSQTAREKALAGFKSGSTRVLVATDIAARGIDVEEISHVINFDIPEVAETYVHRIGRTARAGADGLAISFCDGEERTDFAAIERLIGLSVSVISGHAYPAGGTASARPAKTGARPVARARPQRTRSHASARSTRPPERKVAAAAHGAVAASSVQAPKTTGTGWQSRVRSRGRSRAWGR